jgi:Domain of unknown function (DUF4440)
MTIGPSGESNGWGSEWLLEGLVKKQTLASLSATAALLLTAGLSLAGSETGITQKELVSRTQEMFDAVAGGDQRPWNKYFRDDAMYFDETGHNMDKAALIKSIRPLPQGYSGKITIVNAQSRMVGDTVILSYDMHETEIVFGQKLSARYHATDTWIESGGNWQIVAGRCCVTTKTQSRARPIPACSPSTSGNTAWRPVRK